VTVTVNIKGAKNKDSKQNKCDRKYRIKV